MVLIDSFVLALLLMFAAVAFDVVEVNIANPPLDIMVIFQNTDYKQLPWKNLMQN